MGQSPQLQSDEEVKLAISGQPDVASINPSGEDDLRTVIDGLGDLRTSLTELTSQISQEHARAAHQEAVIDRLHQENERLKEGEAKRLLDPVLRDLIRLHAELERTASSWVSHDDVDTKRAIGVFESLALDVELILGRQGVDRFTAGEGDSYSRREHRAVGAVLSDDASRDGTIAEVLRCGFRNLERVIQPVEVTVFRAGSEVRGARETGARARPSDPFDHVEAEAPAPAPTTS